MFPAAQEIHGSLVVQERYRGEEPILRRPTLHDLREALKDHTKSKEHLPCFPTRFGLMTKPSRYGLGILVDDSSYARDVDVNEVHRVPEASDGLTGCCMRSH